MKRIFLIEDSEDDYILLKRALQNLNSECSIIRAVNGVEALNMLFKDELFLLKDNPPELFLLDIKIPKINGLEVLEKIKSNSSTKNIPSVVFTSSNEKSDIKESYDLGVNSFIRKPVEYEELKDAIVLIGRYWLDLNEGINQE